MTLILAWAIALLLGLSLWTCLAGAPRNWPDRFAALGGGTLLGLACCGLTVRLPSWLGWQALPDHVWLWPLAPALLAAVPAWRSLRRTAAPGHRSRPAEPALTTGQILLVSLLLLLVLLRSLVGMEEAWLRPLFGWDAWLAWSNKARTWVLAGQALPFVAPDIWWAGDDSVRTAYAWAYPELLAWIQVWLASAAGGWYEGAVNLAWPVLWLALLVGGYGLWRGLGVSPFAALLGVYALASLPLLQVHSILAGYGDLWLATALAFGLLAWLRWRETGCRRQLLLTLVLAGLLPLLKHEGMIWAIGLAGLVLWTVLARWPRPYRALVVLAAMALVLLASWLLDLAWFQTLATLFASSGSAPSDSVAAAILSGMYTQENWHLLWYLAPVILLWRWRLLLAHPGLAGLLCFLLGGLILIWVLFLCSGAGIWAQTYTAVNRIVLQLVPGIVSLLVLLAGRPLPVAGPVGSSTAPSVPAEPDNAAQPSASSR